jgi:RNA polymerase sigma-70 factor (ECF subfamily)
MSSHPGTEVRRPPGAAPEAFREQDLVAAVSRGDRKAAAAFVARYTDSIYAYVQRRLRPRHDLVEDVVQDVFLSALGGLETFRGDAPLGSWLLGIARHKVEAFYRERLKAPDVLGDSDAAEPVAEGPLVDDTIDRERAAERTQRVLSALPERYRLVLLWRYWEGRTAREMAAATGRTEKAVERLLARARALFKCEWERGDGC